MTRCDLLPTNRQRRLRRVRTTRRWLVGGGVYLAALVFVGLASLVIAPPQVDDVERRLARTDRQIADSARLISSMSSDLHEADRVLTTMRQIGPKPDWSIVLANLVQTAGAEVVLREVSMRPATSTSSDPDAIVLPTDDVVLRVSGHARDQTTVTRFILAMNDSPLIDSAKLVKAERERLFDQTAASFVIECAIGPRAEDER